MSVTPIAFRMEHRLWRLAGTQPDAASLAAMKNLISAEEGPRSASDRVERHGNEIRIWMPVTERCLIRWHGHIPKTVQGTIAGKYSLVKDGVVVGTTTACSDEVDSLQPIHRDLPAGTDPICLSFDNEKRTATLVAVE